MDEVPQIEVLEPIVADGLALSSSANLSKKRIREEAISPTELVAVDIEGNGRGDWLTRKAGSRRRFWSLTTPRTRSGSMGQSLVMRRRDGGGFPMNHAEVVVHTVRADLGGHLKYSRRWSGVRAGVLLGAQGAVRRGENRGGL